MLKKIIGNLTLRWETTNNVIDESDTELPKPSQINLLS